LKDVDKALDDVGPKARTEQVLKRMTDDEIKSQINVLDNKWGTSSRFTDEDDELLYQLNQELIRRSK